MGGSDVTRRRIYALAQRRQGVAAREELIACGMTARRIERALARGDIRALFPGVYLVGPVLLAHSLEAAAVLACGPGAVLSHRSAVWLYGLLPYPDPPEPIDVTVTGGRRGSLRGIRVHRTTRLAPYEIRERHGVPVTAPARVLIDFASGATRAELERAVSEAFANGLVNRAVLVRACDRARGRRGVARLRSLLEGGRGPQRSRSRPERDLLEALREADLPEPETNCRIGRWEADLYWPDFKLVVEVDGYAAHSSPTAFERDRRKSAELADRGLDVRRVSAKQVRDELELTVARIARALALRQRASPPRPPGGARARPSAG